MASFWGARQAWKSCLGRKKKENEGERGREGGGRWMGWRRGEAKMDELQLQRYTRSYLLKIHLDINYNDNYNSR